jgi:four helix bundle protein
MQNAECRIKDRRIRPMTQAGGTDGGEADPADLKARTKTFALRIVRLFGALPNRIDAQVLGKQLLRSGTSVGAHYREACRARSPAEFLSKMEGGLQELDETVYWLELLAEAEIFTPARLADQLQEAGELMAIFVSSIKTAKSHHSR